MRRPPKLDSGLIAGFLAQALQYGAGLMLMPFVVSRLSAAEVGIWYVFLAAQSFAAVADFGFQPTLARFFSLAHLGAPALSAMGMGEAASGTPNLPLTRSLLRAARQLYAGIALAAFALLAIGSIYVCALARAGALDVATVRAAWLIFGVAVATNLYFMWMPAFLMGSARVTANYVYLILSRGGFALFGIAALLAGGGLLALSLGFLVSQLTARLLAAYLLRGTVAADGIAASSGDTRTVFAAIWPNASRLGLVSIGAFLIARYNVLMLSSTVGLATSASYAICLQLLSGIASVSQLPMQTSLPKTIAARVNGDRIRFRRIVFGAAGFYWTLFLCATLVLVMAGQPLLGMIGSRVMLLERPVLLLFALVMALEGFHSMAAFVITTRNAVPFVWPALLSGVAVVLTTTLAIRWGYGVAGAIACQGLVQLAYNNWKWPVMVYQECRI